MPKISQKRVKELYEYNPDTGTLIWRVTKGYGFPGKIAGDLKPEGYRRVSVDGKRFFGHVVIWLYMTGYLPKYLKEQIDHINMIRDDNRWCNLRLATDSQNMQNRKK